MSPLQEPAFITTPARGSKELHKVAHVRRKFSHEGREVIFLKESGARVLDLRQVEHRHYRKQPLLNRQLAALRRGFKLAIQKGLLAGMPVFDFPKVQNSRTGFFEEDDFTALMVELPADVGGL